MLDKLFSTPVQELEKAGEGIVMDGSRFYFIFKNADTLKKAYGHSINSKRCPQLALFVKETMGFYRELKNDIFLDRKITAGY